MNRNAIVTVIARVHFDDIDVQETIEEALSEKREMTEEEAIYKIALEKFGTAEADVKELTVHPK